jgi:hypothetical protein
MADFETRPLDINKRLRKFGAPGQQLDLQGKPLPAEVRFPDHYSPPADANTFTKTDFYASAGNDSNIGALATPNLVIQLPQDSVGVIRDFSRYMNDMVATDSVIWTLRINGNPVPNWSSVTMFPRVAAFASSGDDPYILLPSGAIVDVLIVNGTVTAHKIGASFYGWFWPNRKAGV